MENNPEMKKDIPPDVDFILRNQTAEEKKRWDDAQIGEYRVKLDLSEEQADKLKENVFLELDAIKAEREALGLEKKWEERDRQYDGQLAPIKSIKFAIDVRESKIKVDSLVRACKEAFLPDDGDIVDVSPRPETARNDGWAIAEKQQQFIDFAMDEEIKPTLPLTLAWLCAFKKYVGIIKQCWSYRQEIRRREEHWEGKLTIVGMDQAGNPVFDNEGLRNFLQMYPDAPQRYPGQVQKLMEGKSVDIVVSYKEQVKNNPQYKYVKIEDFYVRNACQHNDGLACEHLIGERQMYSYWELVKMQESGEFENIEQLWNDPEKADDNKGSEDYKTKDYAVIEFTTYMKIKDGDKEETKIKCWFSEENKVFLGACQYPFYSIDCDYTGFWPTINDKGFYGDAESVMYDLRDTHLAQDALISLMLHSIYVRNIITPIVREGSEVEQMFLDHDFDPTKPLPVDDLTDDVNKAMSFVNWPVSDTNGGLIMLEKLKKIGSDVSRVSDLVTGGESELDPSAPASKTIALLQQSGVGIKDYIKTLLPSFNITAGNILQLYYQMSTDDRKYRIRTKSKQVTGKDIFGDINRQEMVVKTNIQSRAASFAFDKVMEKREGLAVYNIINSDPYSRQIPQVRYKALKTLLSTFGGRWRTISESDLPSPESLQEQQLQVAMMAIQQLFAQAKQKEKITGVASDPKKVIESAPGVVAQAQAVAYDPSLMEEQDGK